MANYFKSLNESFDRMYGDSNVFESKRRKLKEAQNDIFSMTLSEYAESQGVDVSEAESWVTMHPEKTISKLYFSEDEDSPYTGIVYTDGTVSVVGARFDDDVKDFSTMRKVLLSGSEDVFESKRHMEKNNPMNEDGAEDFLDDLSDNVLQHVYDFVFDDVAEAAEKLGSLPDYLPMTEAEAHNQFLDAVYALAKAAFIKYCVDSRDDDVYECLKEDKKPSEGNAIDRYQSWVDFDMSRYGKISDRTQQMVNKAGYQILKDDHGDYEVAAGHFE